MFVGYINNHKLKARIITHHSPWDHPDIYRWYVAVYFANDSGSGVLITNVNKDKEEAYRFMPNPYQAVPKEQCIENATIFLEKLGFVKDEISAL